MSSSGPDISELSESQRSALETYTTVTGQEPVEAIALLGRSQWNVQVGSSMERKIPVDVLLILIDCHREIL